MKTMERLQLPTHNLRTRYTIVTGQFFKITSEGSDAVRSDVDPRTGSQDAEELKAVLTPTLKDSIAYRFGSMPEVETVFTAHQDGVFYACIVVDDVDRDLRYKIYNVERSLIDEFEMFEFNFSIVSRRGRNLKDVISDPALELAFSRQ